MGVTITDIRHAYARIANHTHFTPLISSRLINQLAGCNIIFKADNLQKIGAFKARGACNAIFSLDEAQLARGVITHSSGNHGAALAWAAQLRNAHCTVVMPDNAPQVKQQAVEKYGAEITYCAPTLSARESTVDQLITAHERVLVHPYDDDRIIAGQGTAALETLQQLSKPIDILMTPVGGGGLLGGSAIVAKEPGCPTRIRVIGAEPIMANDAWESFNSGIRVTHSVPNTIADGLRSTLGARNFTLIRNLVDDILLTSEARIVEAMRLIWTRLKVVVEPSAAVPLAAILDHPEIFSGQRVAVILSGGNLDLDQLPW